MDGLDGDGASLRERRLVESDDSDLESGGGESVEDEEDEENEDDDEGDTVWGSFNGDSTPPSPSPVKLVDVQVMRWTERDADFGF